MANQLTETEVCISIALRAHFAQANKYSGEPYVLHLLRVASRVKHLGSEYEQTAWLHDSLEDTELTIADLMLLRVNAQVIEAVMWLTKTPGQPNELYYERIKQNQIARMVKLADIDDNFSRNHLIEDEATRLRMALKYSLGKDILGA